MFYKFDQVGKGIDPNAPKKEGFALFFDILYREFWSMAWLNLYFLLFCIPIFTIGASYAALCAVLVRMIRDKPVDPFYEFLKAFKANFKQSTAVYCFQIMACYLLLLNYFFYKEVNPSALPLLYVVGVLLAAANLYFIPILVSVDIPLNHIIKNGFFLSFLNLKHTVVGTILFLITTGLSIWCFPYSSSYFVLFGAVFSTFVTCFLTHYGIAKYCYPKEEGSEEVVEKVETHEEEMARLDAEIELLKKEAEDA